MERTRFGYFDPDAIDGDGQSRPMSHVPIVTSEPERSRPLLGVLVCTASVVLSLAILLWGVGQLFARAVAR
jgi:hypothetical protein